MGLTARGFLIAVLMLNIPEIPVESDSVHWDSWWTYTGISGSSYWGLINPDWGICNKGKKQSPIDLNLTRLLYDPNMPLVEVNKERVNGHLINTGHTLKFTVDKDEPIKINMTGGPMSYEYRFEELLIRFGLNDKVGSEHRIANRSFSGEIQLIGYNAELYENFMEAAVKPQGLVAIGIVLMVGSTSNPELRLLIDKVEKVKYRGNEVPVRRLSIAKLFPETTTFITYEGSYSIPPCYETVTWIIINKPIYITKQQLQKLRETLESEKKGTNEAPLGNNFRDIVPLNNRCLRTNIQNVSSMDGKQQCGTMGTTMYWANKFEEDNEV